VVCPLFLPNLAAQKTPKAKTKKEKKKKEHDENTLPEVSSRTSKICVNKKESPTNTSVIAGNYLSDKGTTHLTLSSGF
jgi:hypothetical protein